MLRYILFGLVFICSALLKAQIPNRNMETWQNGPVLHGWKTNSRPLTLPPWEPYIVRQDSQAFEGKFAAGFYANGLFRAEATCTFPVRYHPKQLELWYKLSFAPCVNDPGFGQQDTVQILVDLLNNGQIADSGRWESSLPANQYTRLTIPLSQGATEFDSCRITIKGGLVYGGCGIVPEATYLLTDALSLRYSDKPDCIDPEIGCPECGCPEYYEPVCGCDGITYGNTCEALRAGVSSWDMGICSDSAIVCLDSTKICTDCPCPAVYAPVCGCDGITYDNSCLAENEGIVLWTNGTCQGTRNCKAKFYFWHDPLEQNFHFSYGGIQTDSLLFRWDFGDGNSSSQPFISHTYADTSVKAWEVCLEVTHLSGACMETFCDSVRIESIADGCHAGFGFSVDPDGSVTFSSGDPGPGEPERYWLLGDSIINHDDSLIFKIDTTSHHFICQVLVNDSLQCRDTVCINNRDVYQAFLGLRFESPSKPGQLSNVFPNPIKASESLHLKGSVPDGWYDVLLIDPTGRIILQQKVHLIKESAMLIKKFPEIEGLFFIIINNNKSFYKSYLISSKN
jgi:hypothetical protein